MIVGSISPAATVHASLPAQVVIIDDSVVARTVLARMIEATGRFQVAGSFSDVRAGLAYLRDHAVDVVLLDIAMPGIDGITALPDVIAAGRGAKVLIVSSSADEGAAVTVQALALGAADTLVKPGIGAFAGRFAEKLQERLLRLVEPATGEVHPAPEVAAPPALGTHEVDLVTIGASTGGIHALSQVLRAIPPSFTVPILITQHLPASFMPYFAAQVADLGRRPCEVADDHMRVRAGHILVAPGDAHLRVVRTSDGAAVRLSDERAVSGCTPSVDPMFESAADVFGRRAVGVVLSGMGRDGAEGARALVEAGARVVAQDRASSVVWGMPGAVATSGCASAVLPPHEIGRLIATLGGGR